MTMIVPGRKHNGKVGNSQQHAQGVPQYHLHPAGCASKAERRAAAKPLRAYPFTQELVVENLLCSMH